VELLGQPIQFCITHIEIVVCDDINPFGPGIGNFKSRRCNWVLIWQYWCWKNEVHSQLDFVSVSVRVCACTRLPLCKVLSESSWTVIVIASVKEDERGGQGHISASPLHQSAMWHHAVNPHYFYTSSFWLCVSFCLQLLAKSSNMSPTSFAWSSVNPLPKHLKCFVRLLENIL
jgi:hypothetical protein